MAISPTYYFSRTFNISPSFLKENDIKLILLDIDNTLITYGQKKPTDDAIKWINSVKKENIIIILASNNHKKRVEFFNKELGLPFYYHSMKPFKKCVTKTIKEYNVKENEIAIIGDQIFTDILCAYFSKTKSILVKPLPYKENLFFKFKRLFEKPIINNFKNKHPENCYLEGADYDN